jgi:hypothetical protein
MRVLGIILKGKKDEQKMTGSVCEHLADKDYADQLVDLCRRYTSEDCFVPYAMSILVLLSESMSLSLDKSWVMENEG